MQTYEISSSLGDPGGPWFSGDGGGVATIGHRELQDLAAECHDDCYARNRALGIFAHELGHAFSLPHPHEDVYSGGADPCDEHCDQTVMWVYPKYPHVGLLDVPEHPEMDALRRNPIFSLDVETVHLSPGWNLVSFPLRPQPAATPSVLSSVGSSHDVVYAWNPPSGSWLSYVPGLGHGTLKEMGPDQGYWVHASRDCVLTIG